MSASQWTHDWSQPDEDGKLLPYAKVYDANGASIASVVKCNVTTGAVIHIESGERVFGYMPPPLRVEFEP